MRTCLWSRVRIDQGVSIKIQETTGMTAQGIRILPMRVSHSGAIASITLVSTDYAAND
jgi:hypothetical protein